MKKIGILTFHYSHNCGSILQAYALQEFLYQKKLDATIIDFVNPGQTDLYSIFSKEFKFRKIIRNMILLPHYKILKKHFDDYISFKKKHLVTSNKRYTTSSSMIELNNQYSIFIAGSDQIWNVTIKDYSRAYLLDFVNDSNKRIAYSPSFGAKNPLKVLNKNEMNIYKNDLLKFDSISIRENNGSKWLNNILNKSIPVTCDPTLFLKKNDYEKLEEDSQIDYDYIYYYSPRANPKLDKYVQRISKKYNLKVICWSTKDYYLKNLWSRGFKLANHQNPGVYLNLIRNAKLVFTTSYHGTIFSTIYRKNFWVIKNGGMYGDDDRVRTLLNQLSFEHRVIEPNYMESFDYFTAVDYNNYEKNLENFVENSKKFLIEAINFEK